MSKQRIEYLKEEHWKTRSSLERSSENFNSHSHFFGIKQLSWMHSMTESEMNEKLCRPLVGIFNVRKHFISTPDLFSKSNNNDVTAPGVIREPDACH